MGVIKDMNPPSPPPTGMAARYEVAWNEVVAEQPPWKQKIIIENFEVIGGKHIYHDKSDQRIINDVAKEAIRRAEGRK